MFRCLCTDPLTLQGWFSLDLNVFFTFFSSSSFPLNSTRVQISSVTVCLTQISSLRLCVWLQGITKTCSEFLFTCKQRLLLQWVLQTWSGQLLKWYDTESNVNGWNARQATAKSKPTGRHNLVRRVPLCLWWLLIRHICKSIMSCCLLTRPVKSH